MKILAGTLASALILLLSFQNCQKPPHPDEINQSALNLQGGSQKIDLNHEVVESVNLIYQDSKVVSKANNSYTVVYNKTLQVDLNTGIILESSDIETVTANYCLTEALKNELVSILKSSQVCKSGAQVSGQVCGQSMKLPYAQLITSRDQFDLGSASDTCGSNAIDLCDAQPDLLKGYIQNLKSQYKQLSCPN